MCLESPSSFPCQHFLNSIFSMFGISRKSPAPHKKEEDKKPHIKKPLNAFMLYMKEMRAKVVAECTLKESAAINQILGRRVIHTHTHSPVHECLANLWYRSCLCQQWHSLSREEQAKYYELARKERQLHSQLYPGWSARDNYVSGSITNTIGFFWLLSVKYRQIQRVSVVATIRMKISVW